MAIDLDDRFATVRLPSGSAGDQLRGDEVAVLTVFRATRLLPPLKLEAEGAE